MTVRVGLIGCGYWGRNLLRNFAATPGCEVVAVAEANRACLDAAGRYVPGARFAASASAVIEDPAVDAVVIATPISTHYGLAAQALRAGKHVLVEKPLAQTPAEAGELVALARDAGVVLMVDHTYIYSGAVEAIRRAVAAGRLGELLYVDSTRANFGAFQADADVIEDLGPHDFAILEYVLGRRVECVTATGVLPGAALALATPSHAHIHLALEGGAQAHLNLSWMSPEKVRRMVFCGSRGMLVYDDTDELAPLRLYEWSIEVTPGQHAMRLAASRSETYEALPFDRAEPLARMAAGFVVAVAEGGTPRSDGAGGSRVVRLVEAARRSMRLGGQAVVLNVDQPGRMAARSAACVAL